MKKIISIFIVAIMLASSIAAMIPASAAAAATFDIKWNELDYVVYNDNSNEVSMDTYDSKFTTTKTDTTLGANRKGSSVAMSYISTTQFALTETTEYEYVIKVKSNANNKYAGVPFAIDSNNRVYFAYGSYNNSNDTRDDNGKIKWPTKSYIITARADFDYKYPSPQDEGGDEKYFVSLKLEDGFCTLKFVYTGLTVKVYALNSSGEYVQMGYDVSLPDDSKVAFGIYGRDGDSNNNRTVTIKNGVVSAMNKEAAKYIVPDNRDFSALKALINSAKEDYAEEDYTEDSWVEVASALADAEDVVKNEDCTQEDIDAAKDALQTAIDNLEEAELDTSALEEAIAKAKTYKEIEYTKITYNLLAKAIVASEEVLADAKAGKIKQGEINAALESLNVKIRNLVPSGLKETEAAPETQAPETQAPETQAPETQAPATEAPATQAPATEAPATEAPATQAPATEAPATEAPATQAPATQAPATQAPATQYPETQYPATQYPATQYPATAPVVTQQGGCGASIALSALAVVGVIGTALVIKKKED